MDFFLHNTGSVKIKYFIVALKKYVKFCSIPSLIVHNACRVVANLCMMQSAVFSEAEYFFFSFSEAVLSRPGWYCTMYL